MQNSWDILLCIFFINFFGISLKQGKAKKVVQAQNLWFEILKSQIETGTPYMLFKVSFDPELADFDALK